MLKTFNTTACAARSFTYLGQPFGYVTAPQATVMARNAAGATTANYAGALWKLAAPAPLAAWTPASPGLAWARRDRPATPPALTSNSNGTGVLAGAASDTPELAAPGRRAAGAVQRRRSR